MGRLRQITCIIGASGTGKTTLARGLVRAAVERGERVRVLDPGRQFGQLGCMPTDSEDWLSERLQRGDTTFLYVDDCEACQLPLQPSKLSPWRHVYARNRWLPMDVLFCARRAQAIAPMALASVRYVFLFWVSPADVPGLARLEQYAPPGFTVPRERFTFVMADLELGALAHGRTLPGGGWQMDGGGT